MLTLSGHALRLTVVLTFTTVAVFKINVEAQPRILSCTTTGYSFHGSKQQAHRFVFDNENKTLSGGEFSGNSKCEDVQITEVAITATCGIFKLYGKNNEVTSRSDNLVRIDRVNGQIQITYHDSAGHTYGKASGTCRTIKRQID